MARNMARNQVPSPCGSAGCCSVTWRTTFFRGFQPSLPPTTLQNLRFPHHSFFKLQPSSARHLASSCVALISEHRVWAQAYSSRKTIICSCWAEKKIERSSWQAMRHCTIFQIRTYAAVLPFKNMQPLWDHLAAPKCWLHLACTTFLFCSNSNRAWAKFYSRRAVCRRLSRLGT